MKALYKRGQLTLFLIFGLVIVLLMLGIFLLAKTVPRKDETSSQNSFNAEVTSFKSLRDLCLKTKFEEARSKYGFGVPGADRSSVEQKYEAYLNYNVVPCINTQSFVNRGINVESSYLRSNVKITDNSVIADITYPVVLSSGSKSEKVDTFSYVYPIEKKITLPVDSTGRLTKSITYISSDGKSQLLIPSGTTVRGPSGSPLTTLDISPVERNFNSQSNPSALGQSAYQGSDGTTFSPYALLTIAYTDKDLPPYFNEKLLTVAYFDTTKKVWKTWPTESIDTIQNKVTARVNHFSINSISTCPVGEINQPEIIAINFKQTNVGQNPIRLERPFKFGEDSMGCLIEGSDTNIRVSWECMESDSGKCDATSIEGSPASPISQDVPAKIDPIVSNNRILTTITPHCVRKDQNGVCIQWDADGDFYLTFYGGKGLYKQCIASSDDTTEAMDVTSDGCQCNANTISTAWSSGDSTCCADGKISCDGSCTLADCRTNEQLLAADIGCKCSGKIFRGQYGVAPSSTNAAKDFCCKAGEACSLSSCKSIIGGPAQGCLCDSDSECGSVGSCSGKIGSSSGYCCGSGTSWCDSTSSCSATCTGGTGSTIKCTDGENDGVCATNKPGQKCSNGNYVTDPIKCPIVANNDCGSIKNGQCDSAGKKCVNGVPVLDPIACPIAGIPCSDGTTNTNPNTCHATIKPWYCNSQGALVNDCNKCPCDATKYDCLASGICKSKTVTGNCQIGSGTIGSNGCDTATKPKYCDTTNNLVNNCQICGCENNAYACQADGACQTIAEPPSKPRIVDIVIQ